MKMNVHFSKNTPIWETPQSFFDQLNREFRFTLDVCALPQNAKCRKYFSPVQNGLLQTWSGTCWMNPPYGREIAKWLEKAYLSAQAGATVVCLIPSRTDTRWWHEYVMEKAREIRFVSGRLKFGESANSAPFPSAVVIYQIPDKPQNIRTMVQRREIKK